MKIYYFDEEGNQTGSGTSATCPAGATEIAPKLNTDTWNGAEWVIAPPLTLEQLKIVKLSVIKDNQSVDLSKLLGSMANGEEDSFSKQETEARAWNSDNNAATPFLDALLVARSIDGETKQSLIDLIIQKADTYAVAYATLLGKFHRLTKAVDNALTVDEVKLIVW